MLADTYPVVDVDAHVTEPPDLWTSRIGRRWAERAPYVQLDERLGIERWNIGGRRLIGVANWACAGWPEFPPSFPPTLAEADAGSWNPAVRLQRMNEYGVFAQVLYPNILGFYGPAIMDLKEPDLQLDIVRAYNDFLADFAAEDPRRLVPIMALPFWDLQASLNEIKRAAELGHKGILFSSAPEKFNLPLLRDESWEPLWSLAEELDLSINFHVGFMNFSETELLGIMRAKQERLDYAKQSAVAIFSNANAIAEVTMSDLCIRHPRLKFVAVESGFGWLPFFMEMLDWQWVNSGAAQAYANRELPSFYLRRQVYGSFWFERSTVQSMHQLLPDNVMFETDYPHPTSLSPGPASSSPNPKVVVEETLGDLPDDFVRKVLYETAARLYHLDLPALDAQ